MYQLKRLVAVCALVILSGSASAQFFAGYSPTQPYDQQSLDFVADLEGRAQYQFQMFKDLMAAAPFAVGNAASMTAEAFRDGVRNKLIELNKIVPFVYVPGQQTYHYNVGTWSVHDDPKRAGEVWRTRFWYGAPSLPQAQWKRPILVVNDGMGVAYSAGTSSRGYAGENVAEALRAAGHPVMIMALKGFDDKYFLGQWGVHGIFTFDTFMRALDMDIFAMWLQDAVDMAGLLKAWHPDMGLGITGVSKSGAVAAAAALIDADIDRVYLASGFSSYESHFFAPGGWIYTKGERAFYERASLPLALWDRKVKFSYSFNDDITYRLEATEARLAQRLNQIRIGWGKQYIDHMNGAPSHYYNLADVTAFFGQ